MPKLSPAKLKELCQRYYLTPSKKYGQNYLVSDGPINKMILAGELTGDDTVIEVGPGFGILTLALSPLVKRVIAYEIERKLQFYWEEKQKEFSNVKIVWGNALDKLDHDSLEIKNYKIIANLPYQITSRALRTFLEMKNKPERIIVMVQKEVADRICATPGEMSVLAVSVQYYGEPKIVTKVPAGNFWPCPKVDSAVLAITNINRVNRAGKWSDEYFFKIVKAGFANKRKQLWRNLNSIQKELKVLPEKIKEGVVLVSGNEKIRAEDLSVKQWMSLVDFLFSSY